jgi:hypothetical protein
VNSIFEAKGPVAAARETQCSTRKRPWHHSFSVG